MIWIVMIVAGFATFFMRFSMFSGLITRPLPSGFDRYLRYVPIAVLSAIIAASVFVDPTTGAATIANTRVIAAAVAAAVAWFSRSVIATIVTGLGSLWILDALI